MKQQTKIAFLLVIAAPAAVIVWQWRRIAELDDRLHAAEVQSAIHERAASRSTGVRNSVAETSTPMENPPAISGRAATSPNRTSANKLTPAEKQAAGKLRLTQQSAAANSPAPLSAQRRQALMDGSELFNPGPITASTLPVTEKTALKAGQSLQVKYSDTWYAAEVIGFESDGGIHIRYFGWGPTWDEVVPREDLRLDPQARESAVNRYGTAGDRSPADGQ